MVHYCHFLHFEFTFYLHCCQALHYLITAVCRQNPGQLPLPIQRQQAFIQQGTVRCVQLAIAGNTQYLPGLCAPENCVAKSGKKILAIFLLHNRNQQARGVGRVRSRSSVQCTEVAQFAPHWHVCNLGCNETVIQTQRLFVLQERHYFLNQSLLNGSFGI